MIKAIETVYKGYRFRSRLEARWAVFFDSLGLRWDYEKEGFDLGSDGWYLPDFWILDWSLWVEIKPSEATGYLWKPFSFSESYPLLLISGNPYPGEHTIDFMRPGRIDFWSQFVQCRRCHGICLLGLKDTEDDAYGGFANIGSHTCENHDREPFPGGREVAAYQASRSARFEHGEMGCQSLSRMRGRREERRIDGIECT